eukprot:1015014-Rhodomonas_salina.2
MSCRRVGLFQDVLKNFAESGKATMVVPHGVGAGEHDEPVRVSEQACTRRRDKVRTWCSARRCGGCGRSVGCIGATTLSAALTRGVRESCARVCLVYRNGLVTEVDWLETGRCSLRMPAASSALLLTAMLLPLVCEIKRTEPDPHSKSRLCWFA